MKENLEFRNQELKNKANSFKFKDLEATSLLPSFDEKDVDGYNRTFENLAKKNEWPEDQC